MFFIVFVVCIFIIGFYIFFIYLNKVRIWIEYLFKGFMYLKIVNFYIELILFIRGCLCLVVYILNIVSEVIIVYNVDFFFC